MSIENRSKIYWEISDVRMGVFLDLQYFDENNPPENDICMPILHKHDKLLQICNLVDCFQGIEHHPFCHFVSE